jgi:alpha-beta hydrolase superfamily lysophospholipase
MLLRDASIWLLYAGVSACTSAACSKSAETTSDAGAAPDHDAGATDGATDAEVTSLPVGVTTRTWIDTARPTPQNGTAPAQPSRTLATEIWYPTSATSPLAPTLRDVPVAQGGPYPLVLFVHGSSSGRLLYTFLTIALAQAGYVVAAADFPLTALDTPGGPSDLNVSAEVGDLAFLCDQLKAASLDSTDILRGAVDGLGYAVVGHSTGGAVAELAAFAGDDAAITHDPRVRAAVPLSGDACMFDPGFFKTRAVPIFAIGASDDLFVRFANSGQWVFDNTSAPHLLVNLVGGQHLHFTDLGFLDADLGPVPTGPTSPLAVTLQAYGDAGACLPVPPPGADAPISIDTQHALVIQLVTAYLDAEMRQSPAALTALEGANNPLVVFQQ